MSAKRPADPLLAAPRDHGVVVTVPDGRFLTFEGQGSPQDPAFSQAIHAMYAIEFGIHHAWKKRGKAHAIHPLEALWWWGGFAGAQEKEWHWRLMLRQPPGVTAKDVQDATRAARTKHPDLPVERVKVQPYHEGKSMQILHLGPYNEEAVTIARLHDEIEKAGLAPVGLHHEIYLGDPRRARPENLRTLLRQPVRPKRSRSR